MLIYKGNKREKLERITISLLYTYAYVYIGGGVLEGVKEEGENGE